jgi:hypothetical protein
LGDIKSPKNRAIQSKSSLHQPAIAAACCGLSLTVAFARLFAKQIDSPPQKRKQPLFARLQTRAVFYGYVFLSNQGNSTHMFEFFTRCGNCLHLYKVNTFGRTLICVVQARPREIGLWRGVKQLTPTIVDLN